VGYQVIRISGFACLPAGREIREIRGLGTRKSPSYPDILISLPDRQAGKSQSPHIPISWLQILLYCYLLLSPFSAPAATGSLPNTILRNPFFLPGEETELLPKKVLPKVKEEAPLDLVLEATFISGSGRERIALINGQIVKEGETVENKKVVSIEKDTVVLKGIGTAPLVLPAVVKKGVYR